MITDCSTDYEQTWTHPSRARPEVVIALPWPLSKLIRSESVQ